MLRQRRFIIVGDCNRAGTVASGDLHRLDNRHRIAGMREPDSNIVIAEQRCGHQHHVGIVIDAGAHADPQKLVGRIAGDLRRTADTIEIALTRTMNQVCSTIERFDIHDRQGFFQRLDRRPEHFLDDFLGRVLDGQFLVHFRRWQPVILGNRIAEFAITRESQFLGDLHDHGFRDAGIGCDLLQRRVVIEAAQCKDGLDHPCFQRRQQWQAHANARAHCLRIHVVGIHPRPLVARSIIIATRIIRPVARS
ncbi:hypothetical protein D3C71_1434680 [compost metagenome]